MRPRPLLLLLVLLPLSGCLETNAPRLQQLGLINARAFLDGAVPKLRVDAAFYTAFSLEVTIGQQETCVVLPFTPDGSAENAQTIDAGPIVEATVASTTVEVTRLASGTFIRYEMPAGAALDYAPGDSLTVSASGSASGFPAVTIRGKTAESFTLDPVGTSEAGQPLPIVWSPAPAPGSLMTISLRYASSVDSPTANSQVYCVFTDDGNANVPPALAQLYSTSPEPSRSVQAQRVRQTLLPLGRDTRAQLFSFYTVPTPQLINP